MNDFGNINNGRAAGAGGDELAGVEVAGGAGIRGDEPVMNGRRPFEIGGQRLALPLIQGGMGVGISLSGLAGAVAAAGGVGVISTAQIGFNEDGWDKRPVETNLAAIGHHISRARAIVAEALASRASGGESEGDGIKDTLASRAGNSALAAGCGMVAVNIMVATRFYEKYVRAAVKAGADLIISGAGLPAMLPEFVKGTKTKIAPIVSSIKAAKVILRLWDKKYQRQPDLVVVEGPLAGGHLGFHREALDHIDMAAYDEEIRGIMEVTRSYEKNCGRHIPVAVAGGISSRLDVNHYLNDLGADAVQVASRFVTTEECDAPPAYKQAYINASPEDIVIVKSPVGMPGRAIRNAFMRRTENGEHFPIHCHSCLEKCDPAKIPYCITDALVNAARGDVDNALLFCGADAWKAQRIETVGEVIADLF